MIVPEIDARIFTNLEASDTVLGLVHRPVERRVQDWLGWDVERAERVTWYPKHDLGGGDDYFVGSYGVVPETGGQRHALALDHKFVLASGVTIQEGIGSYFGQCTTVTLTTLTAGTQYMLELDGPSASVSRSGMLIRLGAEWPKKRGSVKCTYTAGFTATELDGSKSGTTDYTDASPIRLAVLLALTKAVNTVKAHQYDKGRPVGLKAGESIQGYTYTLTGVTAELLAMVVDLPPEAKALLQPYRKYTFW